MRALHYIFVSSASLLIILLISWNGQYPKGVVILNEVKNLKMKTNNKSRDPSLRSRMTKRKLYDDDISITTHRESITFILGEDADNENMFYKEAAGYYRSHNSDRTEYIVNSCRSLIEVREYLKENPPANNQPWGTINLVTHGNQWLGLSVKIMPGQQRTTALSLQSAINRGVFNPLPVNVIDSRSELFVHGCAVGHNENLLKAMGTAFSSNMEKPLVRASLFFENYTSNEDAGVVTDNRRYFEKAWFAYYKRGYRPGDIRLNRQLNQRYPGADINWRDAFTRSEPRWQGDSYHYTFDVPIKWIVTYTDNESLPDISTDKTKQHWLLDQEELLSVIESTEIPFNKFSWKIKPIVYKCVDGTLIPAIRAKGYATILCILIPLLSDDRNEITNYQPLVPGLYDTTYYYVKR